MNENDLIEKLEKTDKLVNKYLRSLAWYRVFFRGILGGLGATIGVAIILYLMINILSKLSVFESIAPFVEKIKIILENR